MYFFKFFNFSMVFRYSLFLVIFVFFVIFGSCKIIIGSFRRYSCLFINLFIYYIN